MSKRTTSNIFCAAYGHNYFRLKQANPNTPELICKCCKGYFKFEDDGSITPISQKENKQSVPFHHNRRTA
jgi:hypothetical protein